MIRKILIMTYAIVAYLVGTASLLVLMLFLADWLPYLSIDSGVQRPLPLALAINSGLMLLWTIQHIGMARRPFKTLITRLIPQPLERSSDVFSTGLVIGAVARPVLCY